MIHSPAAAAMEQLEAVLASLDGRYLYTSGNHDWHFPHLPWSEATRAAQYPRFERFMGADPACQVRELGDVLLIGLDDSDHQVAPRQLEFLRAQLSTGRPCLLGWHVPLHIPSLAPDVMARWRCPLMIGPGGCTEKIHEDRELADHVASTYACSQWLAAGEADNLAGIFAGHVHFSHVDAFCPGRYQYVVAGGYAGGARVVRLRPL